ncbi:hypothetical protein AB0M46_04295 [Dactylosporangium sp. NPDC051485]|uniref:hypothetical protein n=1 Tax=Dactylosporangium sp. NPDC051485 TaxID=3154846 RepID=UPI003446ADBB
MGLRNRLTGGHLAADIDLFCTFSEDPVFEVIAHGHAAMNGFWVSIAVLAQCAPAAPSAVLGPHGHVLRHARSAGSAPPGRSSATVPAWPG